WAWRDVRPFLPEGIDRPLGAPPTSNPPPRGWIDAGFAPRGRERVTLRLRLRVTARGAYAIGPVRLRAGDWLGFTQTEATAPIGLTLVAYPAPLAVRDRALPSLRPLAAPAARRGLLPDPLRSRGRRPP